MNNRQKKRGDKFTFCSHISNYFTTCNIILKALKFQRGLFLVILPKIYKIKHFKIYIHSHQVINVLPIS